MPGAAVLATGLIGTAGYLFRRSLLHALTRATAETLTAVRTVSDLAAGAEQQARASGDVLLHRFGLERRTSLLRSMGGPALGIACGFVAGAVLTHLFAPKVLAKLGVGDAPETSVQSPGEARQTPTSTPSGAIDGVTDHSVVRHSAS